MSDITLFSLKPQVKPVELKAVALEKEIQTLIENNMETFFGVRFLNSEYTFTYTDGYSTQVGRIDSLGLDENNCPVIFEYKRDYNENVTMQGLFYLTWLLDHKADFHFLVMERLGKDVAELIDWSSPAVYCIANSFGKYDHHGIKLFNMNIRLIRYARGDGVVMFEYINAPSTKATSTKDSGAGSPSDTWTETQYETAAPKLKDVVDEVRRYMSELGPDVSENELKHWLAIKKARNIVCISVDKSKVMLHLKLDASTVETNDLVRDVRGIGHWGTGDVEVSLRSMDELQRIKPLLERAYLEN